MKKLFEEDKSGYSWHHTHIYYLCETEDEYQQVISEHNGTDRYGKSVSIDVPISCRPSTIVLDGYAVHGGHELDAIGVTIHSGYPGTTCHTFLHYIKPGTIKKNELTKTKEWWV